MFYVSKSLSYIQGYTTAVALRGKCREEEAVPLKRLGLSPKVRGEDSQYFHQGNRERK